MSRRKKDRDFWESAELNNAAYIQYYDRLTELSISMFEWRNLPDTVDPRFLELTLFANGMAVFFKDEDDYLALQCAISGPLDVYRIPVRRRAYAVNGFNRELDNTNSVIIYNNMLHKNSMLDVRMFARELYNLDRAISVNANAQKTPILIRCTENERLSLENLYMQFDGNKPIIYGDKQLNPNSLTVLKTDAPYVADKLYTLKTQKWNEALTYLVSATLISPNVKDLSPMKSHEIRVVQLQADTVGLKAEDRLADRLMKCFILIFNAIIVKTIRKLWMRKILIPLMLMKGMK